MADTKEQLQRRLLVRLFIELGEDIPVYVDQDESIIVELNSKTAKRLIQYLDRRSK